MFIQILNFIITAIIPYKDLHTKNSLGPLLVSKCILLGTDLINCLNDCLNEFEADNLICYFGSV